LIVGDLGPRALSNRLAGPGLRVRTGPVVTCIRSRLEPVVTGIGLHYAAHPLESDEAFADFHISVERPRNLRRWIERQVIFRFDGESPFTPLPGHQEFPLLEWGLNWCISSQCHQYVTLHAAVIERGGRALILPAPSGSGKSTLCAGLIFRGWRLLSDELTLIEPATGLVSPLPRPVSLKNKSIDVIRSFAPEAVFSPVVPDTAKGSVAHFRPPAQTVARAAEKAMPGWVVLPRYVAGADACLQPVPKARAFMQLVDNAFNYDVHGRQGFKILARVIDQCDCYEFTYSSLDDAAAVFARLAEPA
jgi:HprK-related kinase A